LGHSDAVDRLAGFVADRVNAAQSIEAPFHHIVFDEFFPADVYRQLIETMPDAADYRPMSGRSRYSNTAGATPTRVKIDLFPEHIRHLPPARREVWDRVGRALCTSVLRQAFVRRLAPGLECRFGPDYAKERLFPIPVLTRDIARYHIAPHTDTRWKGITVLVYLPPDDSTAHIGTVLHARAADGTLVRAGQGRFAPNTGLAFAVGDDSWHSVDKVGPEVRTRDLVILQYFVDTGLQRMVRNRGKRIGNMLLGEMRRLGSRLTAAAGSG
jgi:hypothetical protein